MPSPPRTSNPHSVQADPIGASSAWMVTEDERHLTNTSHSAWMVTEDERHLTNTSHGQKIYVRDGSKPVPQLVARTSIYIYFDLHQGARVLIYIHICIVNPYTRIKMHRSSVLWTFAAASSSISLQRPQQPFVAATAGQLQQRHQCLRPDGIRRARGDVVGQPGGSEPWCTGEIWWRQDVVRNSDGFFQWLTRVGGVSFCLLIEHLSMNIYECRTLREWSRLINIFRSTLCV